MATGSQSDLMKQVVEAYGEGAGDVEIARILGITINRFHDLCEENDQFAELVERGRTMAQAWWYEQGRKGLFADKFSASLYAFNMKNRFGWADKVEMGDKSTDGPVNLDQATAELKATLRRIAKKNPEMLRDLNGDTDD